MTLFETGESTGTVSLHKIIENAGYDIDGCSSSLTLEELFFAVCRGGWPRCLAIENHDAKLEIARDYFRQIYTKDISAADGVNRNPDWTRTLLWSFARIISHMATAFAGYG